MVSVGIIGLGPTWETVYRPALERLRERIVVRAVYDVVADRAAQLAAGSGAIAVPGLAALARRRDLNALLCLDPGWQGYSALELLCRFSEKPILFSDVLPSCNEQWDRLWEAVRSRESTVVPALPLRLTPATRRLQELIATRIGRPQSIVVEAAFPQHASHDLVLQSPAGRNRLAALLDWCGFLVRTAPTCVECRIRKSAAGQDEACRVTTAFLQPKSSGEGPIAEIGIHCQPAEPAPGLPEMSLDWIADCHVNCEHGQASLTSPTDIVWSNGSEAVSESLQSERSAVEVLLDHFCRRAVGGLIPVAGMTDLHRCRRLVDAAQQSLLRSGDRVSL